MAREGCTSVAKCLMIFVGLCYLGSAAGLAYIGVWVFSTYDHFDEIADATLTLLPASIILAVSTFMAVVGVLSVVAAFKSNKLLLAVFFCLILVVLIGEVLAAALGYVYRSKVEGVLVTDLQAAVDGYNTTLYRQQVDYMQDTFSCCGIHNASDWAHSASWSPAHPAPAVPASCCKNATACNATATSPDINFNGCIMKLKNEFRENLIYIAGAAVFMAIIQVLALVSTCILVCRTKEQSPYQVLGVDPVGGGLRI